MTHEALPLANQRVVIVGGTSGMGMGAARATARAGAEVIVVARRPPANMSIEQGDHGSILFRALDMTDDAAVERLFEDLGTIDHLLVTATPPSPAGAFLSQSMSDAQAALQGLHYVYHRRPRNQASDRPFHDDGGVRGPGGLDACPRA